MMIIAWSLRCARLGSDRRRWATRGNARHDNSHGRARRVRGECATCTRHMPCGPYTPCHAMPCHPMYAATLARMGPPARGNGGHRIPKWEQAASGKGLRGKGLSGNGGPRIPKWEQAESGKGIRGKGLSGNGGPRIRAHRSDGSYTRGSRQAARRRAFVRAEVSLRRHSLPRCDKSAPARGGTRARS